MNILLNKFPTKIKIDETIYELNTDFRNCLMIILAFEDETLNEFEKMKILIEMLYKEEPHNYEQAYIKGMKFLDCDENEGEKKEELRLYSFRKDSKYIYSAIKQTHFLDLEEVEYLHWWKFTYLFLDLNKDVFFNQIIYFRKKKAEGKLTKEECVLYREMRHILDLDNEEDEVKSKFEIELEESEGSVESG